MAPDALTTRLGYLLKHAQLKLAEAAGLALVPFGIDGRELAVMVVLGSESPLSQQEAAVALGVDRTTMVALVDGLEGKGLVARRRSAHDRRKNIVELTGAGRETMRLAEDARALAEQDFLAPLAAADAEQLVRALQAVVLRSSPEPGPGVAGR